MSDDIRIFDRDLWRRRVTRAHATGQPALFLLDRAIEDLLDRLSLIKRSFPVAVDLGAYAGHLARALARQPGIGRVIACEASPALLAACPSPKVAADEEWLPFGGESLDIVVSALALQNVNDLPGVLAQIRAALRPDGLLLAAMLGGRTLHELRAALVRAESEIEGGVSPRVAPFADAREIGALLRRAGFALPVVDVDTVRVTYASPLGLLADLRAMGATNALEARRRKPLRRATLLRAMDFYRETFAAEDGRVPATFEIVTLTGWAPHASQQQPLAPGTARVRLGDVLGKRSGEAPEGA